MTSPVIAELSSLARIDSSYFNGAPVAERMQRQFARSSMLAQCLASSIDGHDTHRDPRADAGRFTTEHRISLKWRSILSGDRNAQFLLYRNLQLDASGAFDKEPSIQ